MFSNVQINMLAAMYDVNLISLTKMFILRYTSVAQLIGEFIDSTLSDCVYL